MKVNRLSLALALLFLAQPAAADAPATKPKFDASGILPLLTSASPDALAGAIRGYLVHNMPEPLYEAWPGWGNTCNAASGLKWKGQGLGVHPEIMYKRKNDGKWGHICVNALNPADNLVFD